MTGQPSVMLVREGLPTIRSMSHLPDVRAFLMTYNASYVAAHPLVEHHCDFAVRTRPSVFRAIGASARHQWEEWPATETGHLRTVFQGETGQRVASSALGNRFQRGGAFRPARLDVRVTPKSENWHCACWVTADTETVIHKGVVENAYDQVKPPIPLLEAEAGSAFFVLRPYTWCKRLIAPLVRQ